MLSIEDFKNVELRVAEILSVEPHPDADRLYLLKIKVAETEKQIVAGIKKAYSPEELIGKKIVVVNNLQPATIRGVESQGMLLAASDDNGMTLLVPEREISSGASVR